MPWPGAWKCVIWRGRSLSDGLESLSRRNDQKKGWDHGSSFEEHVSWSWGMGELGGENLVVSDQHIRV